MPIFLASLFLAAALSGDPQFEKGTELVRSGESAAAVPVLQDLLGRSGLTDGERALLQVWLATAHDGSGDALRSQAHLQRAVTLDSDVRAPTVASAELRARLAAMRPRAPVPWLQQPSGIVVVTSAAVAGLAAVFAGLVATDIVVTDLWLDGWYANIEDGRAGAAPDAFAQFVGQQNATYSRVRQTRRADVALLAVSGVVVLGASALTIAALLTPADEAE